MMKVFLGVVFLIVLGVLSVTLLLRHEKEIQPPSYSLDYDESLEMFDSEITEAMEASGIELEYSWSNDLSDGHIASIIEGVVKAASEYKDDDLIGALHTHINDRLFEAEEIHGQSTIAKWDERLSEML